jgi:hypothetical protein
MQYTRSGYLERTIELDKLISLNPDYVDVAAFAEDNNVVVLYVDLYIFMIHLDSLKFKKLLVPNVVYHPFESVYAAGNSMPLPILNSINYDAFIYILRV